MHGVCLSLSLSLSAALEGEQLSQEGKTDNSRNGQIQMGDIDGKEIDVWAYISFSFVWWKLFKPSDSIIFHVMMKPLIN